MKHFHKKNKCKKMLNFSKFLIFASVSLAIMKLQNLGNWGIQRSIRNPKHLRWSISWKVVNYFCKTLHLRFLAGFWIHLRNHLSHRTSTVQKQLFPDVLKIGVFKNFSVFTGKHLRWSIRPGTLLKEAPTQVFLNFLRAPFLQNTYGGYLWP